MDRASRPVRACRRPRRAAALDLAALLLVVLVACGQPAGHTDQAPAEPPAAAEPASAADPDLSADETAPAESTAADEHKNVIRWSTASEVDNFGYDVYRGEAEDGPFEVINDEPIAGAGTTDEVSRYAFEDTTIDPTKRYYYFVESISMAGERERFTPVFAAKPKIGGDDESAEPAEAEPSDDS